MEKIDTQIADLKSLLKLKNEIAYFQDRFDRFGEGPTFLEYLKAEFRGIQNSMKESDYS